MWADILVGGGTVALAVATFFLAWRTHGMAQATKRLADETERMASETARIAAANVLVAEIEAARHEGEAAAKLVPVRWHGQEVGLEVHNAGRAPTVLKWAYVGMPWMLSLNRDLMVDAGQTIFLEEAWRPVTNPPPGLSEIYGLPPGRHVARVQWEDGGDSGIVTIEGPESM